MTTKRFVWNAATAAISAAVFLAPIGASAASQCKGMAENACQAQAQCTWVDGYTRKDGRSVAAHCKSKPAAKGNKAALSAPKVSQVD